MSMIPFVPEIPPEIVSAIETGRLVIFIGAGVSAIAGLPLWNTLAKGLIQSCKEFQYINEEECDLILSKISDPKKLISIAYEKFKKDDNLDEYYSIFYEKLKLKTDKLNKDTQDIFTFCKRSNALVLTTNADLLLDDYFENELIYVSFSDEALASTKPGLVKIHGSLNKRDSLVFTSIEYLKQYADYGFKNFLHNLFSGNRVILFVGYGLSEFELLEYTLGTAEEEIRNNIFVLSPYFSYEQSVKESMDQYYESLNIRQIAYCKDKKGYNQLAEVLCSWQKEIEKKTNLRLQTLETINNIISSAPKQNDISVLLQITSSQEIENYLFIQLRKVNNLIEWTNALIDTPLFDPDIKLLPVTEEKISEERTSYRCPVWYGLMFIDFALKSRDCSAISDKIISFVNKIFISILSYPEKASNFNALYSIASIISRFNENISGEKLFECLMIISESTLNDFNDFISVLLAEKTGFFNWDNDDISKTLEILFNYLITNSNDKVNYIIAKSVLKEIDFICRHIDSSTVINLVDSIEKIEKNKALTFASVGSIERYHFNINYQRTPDFILFVLKEYFRSQLNQSDIDIINKHIFKSTKTINKLMVFTVSHHYHKYNKLLFNSNVNPFDIWEVYSDLYYLIQTNNEQIASDNREQLFNWIENTTFGERTISENYKKFLKYNIISLLAKTDSRYKKYSEKYKNYNLSQEIAIDDINKSFIVSDVQWHNNEDLKNKYKQMSLREIIASLENTKNITKFDIYDNSDALKEYLIDNPSRIYEDVTAFEPLNPLYYGAVIDAIRGIGDGSNIINAIGIMLYFLSKEQEDDSKADLISLCFDCIAGFNISDFNTDTQNEIYNFISNLINQNLDLYLKINTYLIDTDILLSLPNHWISKGVDLLLEFTSDGLADKTIQTVDNLLRFSCDDHHHNFLCCVISKNTNKFLSLNRGWVLANLNNIFISEDCVKSFFLFNSRMPKELFSYLFEKGVLTEFVNGITDNTDYVLRSIFCCCVNMYVVYEYDCMDIINKLLFEHEPDYYVVFFEEICVGLQQEKYFDKSYHLLIVICNEITKTNIRQDESYDQAIRYLANCCIMLNNVDSSIWKCLQHLSVGFKHFFSDELFTALDMHFDNYKQQIAQLLISLVNHSHNQYDLKMYKPLIIRIQNESELKKENIELRNCFIDKGIFDID